jgi:predicted NBD/HSP70 family sugar kinase
VHIDRGIGAGMVLGQDLYRGSRYRAGELGHMQVQLNGKECRCGGLGCLETIASLHGIYESCLEQELYEASSQPDYEGFLRWLVDMVDSKHNVVCQEIVKTSAETLGRAIANAVKLLDPGSVVLSGGLVTSCDTFFETARQSILREPLVSLQPEDIGRTELKAMAGLMGAAAVALHRFVYSDRF